MILTVTKECGRCGRQTEMEVSLDDAKNLAENDKLRNGVVDTIKNFASDINPELGPDLIIMTKGADGKYGVKTLSNLCNPTNGNGDGEKKRNRGCVTRVETLVNDIFMVSDPADKKPKEKKAKPKAEKKAEEK